MNYQLSKRLQCPWYFFTDDLQIFEEKEEENTEHNSKEMPDKDLSQQTSHLSECRKSLRARK